MSNDEICPLCGGRVEASFNELGTAIELLARAAIAAEAFVRAHCDLEKLAGEIGAEAASASPLNDRVIQLHMELERAVLGDEAVGGRRS